MIAAAPYIAFQTFREIPRERSLSGAELDNAHALVRIGLNLAERTDYGPEHDAAVRRILEGTSTLAAERAAAVLPEPNHRYKDLFDPAAGKNTMRYDTGTPVNAFDERDPRPAAPPHHLGVGATNRRLPRPPRNHR